MAEFDYLLLEGTERDQLRIFELIRECWIEGSEDHLFDATFDGSKPTVACEHRRIRSLDEMRCDIRKEYQLVWQVLTNEGKMRELEESLALGKYVGELYIVANSLTSALTTSYFSGIISKVISPSDISFISSFFPTSRIYDDGSIKVVHGKGKKLKIAEFDVTGMLERFQNRYQFIDDFFHGVNVGKNYFRIQLIP